MVWSPVLGRRVSLHHLFLHVFVMQLNYCNTPRGVAFCYILNFGIFLHCSATIVLSLRELRFTVSLFLGLFKDILVTHALRLQIVGRTSGVVQCLVC